MKKHLLLLSLVLGAFQFVTAQPPQRTPEEVAEKQTSMLMRELNITDTVQRDTLYRMHLKYARLRHKSNTRREDLERLLLMTEELKGILTEEQFNRFMDKQADRSPRMHQPAVGPMPQHHPDARVGATIREPQPDKAPH
jgi:predicted ArsR family transcriptional regulator